MFEDQQNAARLQFGELQAEEMWLDDFELAQQLQLEEAIRASAEGLLDQAQADRTDVQTEGLAKILVGQDMAGVRESHALQLKAFASAIYNSADANLATESSREAMIAASQCANDRHLALWLDQQDEDEEVIVLTNVEKVQDPSKLQARLLFAGVSQGHPSVAGCSAMLLAPNNAILWQEKEFLGHGNQSFAECRALLLGLKAASVLQFAEVVVDSRNALVRQVVDLSAEVQQSSLAECFFEARQVLQGLKGFHTENLNRDYSVNLNFLQGLAREAIRLAAIADEMERNGVAIVGEKSNGKGLKRIAPDSGLGAASQAVRQSGERVEKLECEICLEQVDAYSVHAIGGCLHKFCRSCLCQHACVTVQGRGFPVRCPAPDCKKEISIGECKLLMMDRPELETLLQLAAVASISEDQRIYCPHPDCSALLVLDAPPDGSPAECPECHRMVCPKCKVPWHQGLTCGAYEHRSSFGEKKLETLAQKERWQKCYHCKAFVELESGCYHMTCKCGAEFCYVCGSKYEKADPAQRYATPTCECALWDEANLIQPEARGGRAGAAAAARAHNEVVARGRARHNPRHPMYKTVLCNQYPRCYNGEWCNFAHGADELRDRPDFL